MHSIEALKVPLQLGKIKIPHNTFHLALRHYICYLPAKKSKRTSRGRLFYYYLHIVSIYISLVPLLSLESLLNKRLGSKEVLTVHLMEMIYLHGVSIMPKPSEMHLSCALSFHGASALSSTHSST